jgi:hypothetical protein
MKFTNSQNTRKGPGAWETAFLGDEPHGEVSAASGLVAKKQELRVRTRPKCPQEACCN